MKFAVTVKFDVDSSKHPGLKPDETAVKGFVRQMFHDKPDPSLQIVVTKYPERQTKPKTLHRGV